MSKHTPGPWVIPTANVFRVIALDEKGQPVLCIVEDTAPPDVFFGSKQIGWDRLIESECDSQYYGKEAAANARLISAAPELLQALGDLLGVIQEDELIPESVSYMKQARAAIAKATAE